MQTTNQEPAPGVPSETTNPPKAQPFASVQALSQPSLPTFPSGIIYINYFDAVTDSKVRGLMALCSDIMAKVKPTPAGLYFTFSSPGGSVAAGITLYNFLRGLPVELTMHNIGSVDSIATVIFLAASNRYACAHSRFLFHGIGNSVAQGTRLTIAQTRELLSGLEQDERRIKELVVERSKITEGEMISLLQQGETKNPAFALEKGIVSDIRDFALPAGSQIITANFQ
jgi:ATP-dependent protease ClpP protease subunit